MYNKTTLTEEKRSTLLTKMVSRSTETSTRGNILHQGLRLCVTTIEHSVNLTNVAAFSSLVLIESILLSL